MREELTPDQKKLADKEAALALKSLETNPIPSKLMDDELTRRCVYIGARRVYDLFVEGLYHKDGGVQALIALSARLAVLSKWIEEMQPKVFGVLHES